MMQFLFLTDLPAEGNMTAGTLQLVCKYLSLGYKLAFFLSRASLSFYHFVKFSLVKTFYFQGTNNSLNKCDISLSQA